MPTQIRPNRLEVSDRFPMLGFTVRTDGATKRFEIAIGTSPELFGPEGKNHRSRSNFYSTRAAGPLPIERGEAVYVLPAEVLARFVGQQKLYYGLATAENGAGKIEVVTMPGSGSPYITISGLTGRSLQRVRLLPNRQRLASNYGKAGSEMDWAGDAATPGTQPMTPSIGKNGTVKEAASPGASFHYDDGYGPLPPPPAGPTVEPRPQPQPEAKSLADDEDTEHGIGGPIPDGADTMAQGLAAISPEFPQASRFEPTVNFRPVSGTRAINRIVIHITDGHKDIEPVISWFQDPHQRNRLGKPIQVSAHYIVGQDGEVVQMVKNNDIAWHASHANQDSIGIEHVARSPHEWGKTDPGLMPTQPEYCASAALVNWLCNQFNLPMDRGHIVGHSEASPQDGHDDCPNGVWDWDYYMGLVTSGTCAPRAAASSLAAKRMALPSKPARASALDDQHFDENWNDVEVLGQPENYSCWATAASMVVGWRDRVSLDIQALKKMFTGKTGVASDTGLYAYDDRKLAEALGLVAEPPQSYTVEAFRQILENYGPLWAGIHTEDGWGHAVVVTGLYGDSTPDNTYVRIHDPWGRSPGTPARPGSHNPTPGQGSRYTLPFSEFEKEYEDQASSTSGTVNVQILHATDTDGRRIGMGADQTYALASAVGTQPTPAREGKARGYDWKKHRSHHAGGAKRGAPAQTPTAQALDADLQPVQLPAAKRLTGWEKAVVRTAVEIATVPLLVPLIDLVNTQGFSVGIGLGGDAGLLGGVGLGFGIILAPNDDVGIFGSLEINKGLLAGLSAGARVIVIRGGIEAFNETGYAIGLTLDPEAGPSVSAIALFNADKNFHGVSFQLGIGAALSPIQIFIGVEKKVSKTLTQSLAEDDQDSLHGIGGPIPDDDAAAQSLARSLALSPEYPQATRFEPAASVNYRAVPGTRTINRVVIHITDGGPKIGGTMGWFKNPDQRDPKGNPIHVSAHYVVGQDGEVVQMVKNNDVAWHASGANGDSVGIEHVANTHGLKPTGVEYCASAALVNWLCNQFNIPMDRDHVVGHNEASPRDHHVGCPDAVWDWDYYMGMVTSGTCDSPAQGQSLSVWLPAPPKPKRMAQGRALDAAPRMIGNSRITTVTGGEGNVSWELDQFSGVKMASASATAPLQSAETIHLANWPYCDHANGGRACAWFTVDWKFSGQALGEIRITPSGAQPGPYPLRVEARIEDDKNRDANTVSLAVRFTYHFSTAEGPEVVATTDLILYSDGSIDQKSNWASQAAA